MSRSGGSIAQHSASNTGLKECLLGWKAFATAEIARKRNWTECLFECYPPRTARRRGSVIWSSDAEGSRICAGSPCTSAAQQNLFCLRNATPLPVHPGELSAPASAPANFWHCYWATYKQLVTFSCGGTKDTLLVYFTGDTWASPLLLGLMFVLTFLFDKPAFAPLLIGTMRDFLRNCKLGASKAAMIFFMPSCS